MGHTPMALVKPMQIPPYIKGLIFDCDGTVADTMPLHYQAWVEALGEHGVDFPEALFYEMAGIPTPRIVELLNERHGHQMPVQETADHKDALYLQLIPKVTAIDPVVKIVRLSRQAADGRRHRWDAQRGDANLKFPWPDAFFRCAGHRRRCEEWQTGPGYFP
jgi:hypothetical protein